MAVRNPPVWMQSGSYQASDDRVITGLLSDRTFTPAGGLVGITGGVVPPTDQLAVTAPGGTMSFNISSGIVIVPASGSNPPGAYICYNDSTYTGTLATETSANPRVDLIVANVDDQATGDATSAWSFQIVKGAAAVNPLTPKWTTNQVPIASVKVIPAASNGGVNKVTNAQITDLRQFTAAPGGVHVSWGGILPPHSPGRLAYDASAKGGSLYLNDGTSYNQVYTFKQWRDYFSAYRPLEASRAQRVQVTVRDVWDHTPPLWSAPATAAPVLHRTDVKTPSGAIKVTMGAFGRCDAATNAGRTSVRVLQGSTSLWDPSVIKGLSFYNTGWEQAFATFVIDGLPTNTTLIVRMEHMRSDNATGIAYWQNCYLMVEPVI